MDKPALLMCLAPDPCRLCCHGGKEHQRIQHAHRLGHPDLLNTSMLCLAYPGNRGGDICCLDSQTDTLADRQLGNIRRGDMVRTFSSWDIMLSALLSSTGSKLKRYAPCEEYPLSNSIVSFH